MAYEKDYRDLYFDEYLAPKFDQMANDAVKSIAGTLDRQFCEQSAEAVELAWREWLAEFKRDYEPEDNGALSLPYDMDYMKQLMRWLELFLLCAMECDL